jgi:hypothetical protein
MATRSMIGMEKDGKIFAAYCHYDGYLEGVGNTLYRHYQNPEKILKLISLGDMSQLDEEFEPAAGVEHSYNKPAKGVTVYYGRDRGEEHTETRIYESRERMFDVQWDCDFFYLWVDGCWIYSTGKRRWHDLAEALDIIVNEDAA